MEGLDFVSLFIGLLLGLLIGYLITRIIMRNQKVESKIEDPRIKDYQKEVIELKEKREVENQESRTKIIELASAEEKIKSFEREILIERKNFEDKLTEIKVNHSEKLDNQQKVLEDTKKQFQNEFQVLADRIFEDKSEKFTKQNKTNLDTLLSPLKDKLKSFEDKVDKTYKDESIERISLKKEIERLMELNHQLSKDANNLATALKGGSKVQGDWGEIQLEMILEKAGLKKNLHFSTQSSFTDEDGKIKRPDLIINLPDNKNLIIDSKVSLVAYDKFCQSEDEKEKELLLKAHIDSIKKHLKDLHAKKYQDLYDINTPDYVLMFVPIEPALNLAIQSDPVLFTYALERNVVLVTNSTLLATLKTVSFIWKQEDQKKNVIEIATQGANLYDKFVSFTEDLLKIGKQLNFAKDGYDDAMKKLSSGTGNLVTRTEKLKKLGLKTKKHMNDKLLQRAHENEDK